MHGFTLYYVIAPMENGANWIWFLICMIEKFIHGINDTAIPFMSDKQKGLIEEVCGVFLEKVHGAHAHHLRGNVKTNHGKAACEFFWSVVYAHTKSQ